MFKALIGNIFQVLHVMSAARGAEQFYTIEHHSSRSEGLELARYLDIKVYRYLFDG